jgi:hypothetical protein
VCWWCSFGQDLLRYADRCRKAIAELWSEDGVQLLQPPQEVLKTAAGLGLTGRC